MIKIIKIVSFIFLLPLQALAFNIQKLNYLPEEFIQFGAHFNQQKKSTMMSESEIEWNQSELKYFSFVGGKKVSKDLLLGTYVDFELFSGIDLSRGTFNDRESRGQGISKFSVWSIYRLREQTEQKGLWDWYLKISPSLGDGLIDNKNGNRLTGRSGFSTGFANGYLILPWEFRLNFYLEHLTPGKIQDNQINQRIRLSSFYSYGLLFQTQYTFNPVQHLLFEIGFLQESIQSFSFSNERKNLQLGSRSQFQLSYKHLISSLQCIQLGAGTSIGEYYIKDGESIEGNQMDNIFFFKFTNEF